MLSKTQQEKIDDTKKALAQLKADFKALTRIYWGDISKKDPALLDLQRALDTWYAEAKDKADTEVDDSMKTMVYLREANAYARMRAYIDKQLS